MQPPFTIRVKVDTVWQEIQEVKQFSVKRICNFTKITALFTFLERLYLLIFARKTFVLTENNDILSFFLCSVNVPILVKNSYFESPDRILFGQ